MKVGIGFDSHPLVAGRRLIIGGVEIRFEKGLEGHSDADVLSHAIGDALLGGMGEGDLGMHFPDTDPAYEGISSQEILKRISAMLHKKKYRVVNIDSTVMAEQPKLVPHISRMKNVLSSTLDVPSEFVSIKATTMERMGFVGRGDGVAAIAVVLLEDND